MKCQKADWKAGHRQACSRAVNHQDKVNTNEKVDSVLRELYSMTQGMSVAKAKEHQDRASDFVVDLVEEKKEEEEKRKREREEPKTKLEPATKSDQPTSSPTKFSKFFQHDSCDVPFLVEEMKYIFQFKATIRPNTPYIDSIQQQDESDFELSIVHSTGDNSSDSCSAVKFQFKQQQHVLFAAIFPRRLVSDRCSWRTEKDNNGAICHQLSLPFEEPLIDHDLAAFETQHSPDIINEIKCRNCEQPLLKEKPIKHAHLLPQGNWDEIADYLICYSGQPMVDFSSSSVARRSVAMQDSNALCLHRLDLASSVCVLAVTGYGETELEDNEKSEMDLLKEGAATVRGNRSWQDSAGGATVCCSQCCSQLGFASMESPETYRLLKHQLLVGSTKKELTSCASFLAREMVRYAESKAIFTFIIGVNSNVGSTQHAANIAKCLLLRLVSWDTNIATAVVNNTERLKFRKVAKLVFEETLDMFKKNETEDDVTKWVWGGVDLCCIPLVAERQDGQSDSPEKLGQVSTVRIQLPSDEYDRVLRDLRRNSHLFSKSVSDATIKMKMGMEASLENLGLTAISLE